MNTNPIGGLSEFSQPCIVNNTHSRPISLGSKAAMTNPNIPEGNPFSESFSIGRSSDESSNLPETRWDEVKNYSEFIARYAGEAPRLELTKENYYDLYNVAVCLLKAVDSLDPDKLTHSHSHQPPPSRPHQQPPPQQQQQPPKVKIEPDLTANTHGTPFNSYMSVPSNGASHMDYYYRGPYDGFFLPRYGPPEMAMYTTPFATSYYTPSPSVKKEQSKDSHDLIRPLDDEDEKKSKRKRKKNVCNTKRNLHCFKCGATETPEWRRGPQGEHTLCNACGLHYAKTLKKQKISLPHDHKTMEQHEGKDANGLSPFMNGLSNVSTVSAVQQEEEEDDEDEEDEEEETRSSPDHSARDQL